MAAQPQAEMSAEDEVDQLMNHTESSPLKTSNPDTDEKEAFWKKLSSMLIQPSIEPFVRFDGDLSGNTQRGGGVSRRRGSGKKRKAKIKIISNQPLITESFKTEKSTTLKTSGSTVVSGRQGSGKKRRAKAKIDSKQPLITELFKKEKSTSGSDKTPSDICEKGETSDEISGRRSDLNMKRPLGGEAETKEDVPPEGAPPPKVSKTCDVQGPSDISDGSTSPKRSEVVAETQSSNMLEKAAKEKKKVQRSNKIKSKSRAPMSPRQSSDNSIEKENHCPSSYVFFGLELGSTFALRRIVAIHDDVPQFDIPALSTTEALDQFINFLQDIPNPVLVAHNAEQFHCLQLYVVLNNHKRWKKFTEVIPRYVDTLPVFKEEYPDQKQLKLNDLRKLVQKENASPVEEDLLEEVKALRELCLFEWEDNYKIKDKFRKHESLMRSLGLPKKPMVNHKVLTTNEQQNTRIEFQGFQKQATMVR